VSIRVHPWLGLRYDLRNEGWQWRQDTCGRNAENRTGCIPDHSLYLRSKHVAASK